MLVLMVLLASALWIAIKWPEALVLLGEQSFWDGVAKAANLATIAAALLAGIALVFAWPQLRQIRLQQQREAAERARRPRLRIELPENPNQSGDPRVEWLHLQVRNVGEPGLTDLPLTAREVHVSVKVDSDVRERALLWLGGSESG